jgi:hypothetical protein
VTDDTLEDGVDPSVAVGWQRKRMDQCCSVRSAWEPIHVLLKRGPAPPPVYQGQYDPKALFNALKVFVSQ